MAQDSGGKVDAALLRAGADPQPLRRDDRRRPRGPGRRRHAAHGARRSAPRHRSRCAGRSCPAATRVRYRVVSADSHVRRRGVRLRRRQGSRSATPILAGAGGLSDTSPAAVAARVVELAALGLLVGLLAFRALVWGPARRGGARAWRPPSASARCATARRLFWRAFWALAVLAGVAEIGVLAAKSAVVFHTGLLGAVLRSRRPPTGSSPLRASATCSAGAAARCCALVAVALRRPGARETRPPPSAGRRGPLAADGAARRRRTHAAGEPGPRLAGAAGAAVDRRRRRPPGGRGDLDRRAAVPGRGPAPRAARAARRRADARVGDPERASAASRCGRSSSSRSPGLARMAGELSSPAQLWSTAYGRDLMLKASLLLPILVLARRNRRLVAALGRRPDPERRAAARGRPRACRSSCDRRRRSSSSRRSSSRRSPGGRERARGRL